MSLEQDQAIKSCILQSQKSLQLPFIPHKEPKGQHALSFNPDIL